MDKNQKQLIDTYFRKRKIALQQNVKYDIHSYELHYYILNYFNYETDKLTDNIVDGLLHYSRNRKNTEINILNHIGNNITEKMVNSLFVYSENKQQTENLFLNFIGDDLNAKFVTIMLRHSQNRLQTELNIIDSLEYISTTMITFLLTYSNNKKNLVDAITKKFKYLPNSVLVYLQTQLIINNELQPDTAYKILEKHGDDIEEYELKLIIKHSKYLPKLAPIILNNYIKYHHDKDDDEIVINGLRNYINNDLSREDLINNISKNERTKRIVKNN